jgi:epoxyqueuosine reductase
MNRSVFETDPTRFVIGEITDHVAGSPLNRLESFDGAPIFERPLVAFAGGDDPIFREYKDIIGDFHLTPREAMTAYYRDRGITGDPAAVSVIAWIMPFPEATRRSLRRHTDTASLRWNHARWQGQQLVDALLIHLGAELETVGHHGYAPDRSEVFKVHRLENGPASNWSLRHIAYAAGLGTFSLNDGMITPKGIAMRCAALVCDVPLPPSPRPYTNHLENCLFYRDGSCRRCIERCPAGAISEKGHDKLLCGQYIRYSAPQLLEARGTRHKYIGANVSCGLCQTGVPCERRVPPSRR